MEFDADLRVLAAVGLHGGAAGQLAGLADRQQRRAGAVGERRGPEEPAGVERGDRVVRVRPARLLEAVDRGAERVGGGEQRRDVAEADPGFGEVGDDGHVFGQVHDGKTSG
nr:hypothetical protein GCM10025732_40490 [Glycomyces mayteni]